MSQLESAIAGPEDLPKVRVGTVTASTSESYLRTRRISFRSYATVREGLSSVADGHIDALVYDAPILGYFVNSEFKGRLSVLSQTFERQDYAIALPEGSPLREPVNRLLLELTREPEWRDVLYHYLGE